MSAPVPLSADPTRAWRRRVAELALACAGSFAADEPARLRELGDLIAADPASLTGGMALADRDEWDRLAAGGAALVAVLHLIEAGEGGYLLSGGAGGGPMATVVLPGQGEEVTASGDTPALALIGALALAVAERGEARLIPADLRAPDGVRLN